MISDVVEKLSGDCALVYMAMGMTLNLLPAAQDHPLTRQLFNPYRSSRIVLREEGLLGTVKGFVHDSSSRLPLFLCAVISSNLRTETAPTAM